MLYRLPAGTLTAAQDLCLHRGVPLSMGWIEDGALVCKYHGLRYNCEGACIKIPAHPGAAIPPKLRLQTYGVKERYGLIWVRLVDNGTAVFPEFEAWEDPDYIQILPPSLEMKAAAGRQIEGFLDVSHFAFVHAASKCVRPAEVVVET